MADPTNQEEESPLSKIRKLGEQGLERAMKMPEEFTKARELIDGAMNKLQNPGWTVNAPLLAASLAMFKPTRAGGFGESLAHAGDASIPALIQQRDRELRMNAQIANLAKERGQLGIQEASALMTFPGQAAGLESTLADLRYYEMMREANMPGGGRGRAGAAGSALVGNAVAPGGAPAAGPTGSPPVGAVVGGAPGGTSVTPARGDIWLQTLPPQVQGTVSRLAQQIEIGLASGSKLGTERAAAAQKQLQEITGAGWMYDPTNRGFVAVGSADPNYIDRTKQGEAWAKVLPEASLHALKKQIDSGYEMVEFVDENGQKRRMTNEQARAALGYPNPAQVIVGGGTPGVSTRAVGAPGQTPAPVIPPQAGGGGGAPSTSSPAVTVGGPPPATTGIPVDDAPVSKEGTKAVAEFGTGLRHTYVGNQKLAPRLERMYDILRDLESGSFAEKKGEIIAGLRALGINANSTATANPEAVEKLMKESIQSVFEQIKEVTSRPALQEFLMLQRATANPELQPGANAAIIRQALGLIDYENNVYKDWVGWSGKNPNTRQIDPFILESSDRHKPDAYIDQRRRSLGNLRGEPVPPKEELVEGGTYILPDGTRAKWSSEKGGFVPVKRK